MNIDAAQGVLLFVLVILTSLLLILGIQVFFILKELRRTVSKVNKVLDDTSTITGSVSGPISNLSTLAAGIKTGATIASFFKKRKKSIKQILQGDEEDGE